MSSHNKLFTTKGWAGIVAALALIMIIAPVLNMVVPEGNPLHLSDFAVTLLGKIMCYAILALAMDLIWGYTGILSLGHGVSLRWAATPLACT